MGGYAVRETFSLFLLLYWGTLAACPDVALGAKPPTRAGMRITQDSLSRKLEIEWVAPPNVRKFQVALDDSPAFRQPILSTKVEGNYLDMDVFKAGLAPGITYYVAIEPGGMVEKFRLAVPPWPESYLTYAYLRKAWETTGRRWFERYSGVKWNQLTQNWQIDPKWSLRDTQVGPEAYYLEYPARAGVNMGLVCHDLPLLNELAEFYTVYSNRFTTLGRMRRMKSPSVDTSYFDGMGGDEVRSLIWIDKQGQRNRVLEGVLYNSQFFHPAARLIRVITSLPESERTPIMKSFIATYAPLITREHLLRHLYGKNELVESIWKKMITSPTSPTQLYRGSFTDSELWLVATAAEILGANANEPVLVPLQAVGKARLQQVVQMGATLFQMRRTLYPDTKNFKGEVVGSASYFNGDWYDVSEYAYSGYMGAGFPTEKDKKMQPGASWDISHYYRVPVFLRSLYDSEKATGVDFPGARDVELITNQLVYRVFQGDFDKPLFNNFFDGSNGWYRVGYHGSRFGYPPAQYCDARDSGLACMTSGAIMGWGLIAFSNHDLAELEHSLLTLAWREDVETKLFKDRYYQYADSYSFRNGKGEVQYPALLLWVLAGEPEKLRDCGSP